MLELAAGTDVTVLLEGETGTGKSVAAESLHLRSKRKDGPFMALDCSAIPANLLESELFGHERGAFTGAEVRRIGAFEEASDGTIFLDEIGELPLELQPKLLRVLERREVRRVGSNNVIPVDVRVIAATNRDLRTEVNAGRFRPDLYFRLAVVKIPIPSLRERADDIPDLVDRFLEERGATPQQAARLREPAFQANLRAAAWPGNVRELRNYLEKCIVFQTTPPIEAEVEMPTGERPLAVGGDVDLSIALGEARRRVTEEFEARYLKSLLRKHDGKVAAAATAAKVDRVQLYRLLRKHGLK
jgi:transcriptional regulator with PAS, ATPase and Fis domain